ncbi:extracellular solute-binding protein [Paenibacillus ginsengarvi]|uniref:Extracellular solute-binding protein n=1 Tax=Paenibacillus ginsengarvi TaxID=400777 RepID=A0A3B0CJA9_9BACL|nr:extracellular solute-binding protein [Paenibacillus ginsengarvi]RKN85483.1 extracellular solute-binding protein [Paenibacillus ginsengarvi]
MNNVSARLAGVMGAIWLAGSLAGCSGKTPLQTEQPGSVTLRATGLPITERPVTLQMAGLYGLSGQKPFGQLPFFQEAERRTNVRVEWLMNGANGWPEKKNLMFSSGELPDAFYGHYALSNQEVIRYGTQGVLIPLEKLIEQYAPNLNRILERSPEYRKELTAPDGHIYSLPTIDESYPSSKDSLFINKRWLDQLGLPLPETTEQFLEALRAFKANDMNKNGKPDEIPFTFRIHGNTGIYSMFGSFGLTDKQDHIVLRDGKVLFSPVQPEYREAVRYFRRLFEEGLIDREAFTQDSNVYSTKIRTGLGKIGAFSGWSLHSYFESIETSDYVPLPPLQGPKGDRLWNRGAVGLLSKGAFAITSSNRYPEVTMRWIDYMYDPLVSLQAMNGNVRDREDGSLEIVPAPEGMTAGEYRHLVSPGSTSVFAVTKDISAKLLESPASKEKKALDRLYAPYMEKDIYPNVYFTAEENEKRSRYYTDIDAYVSAMLVKWIVQGGVDSEWDEYVRKLGDMGLGQVMDVYEQAYARYKGK